MATLPYPSIALVPLLPCGTIAVAADGVPPASPSENHMRMHSKAATTTSTPAENKSSDHEFPWEGDGGGGQSLKRPPQPPSPHFPLPTHNTPCTTGHPSFYAGPCPRGTAVQPEEQGGGGEVTPPIHRQLALGFMPSQKLNPGASSHTVGAGAPARLLYPTPITRPPIPGLA